MKEFESALVDAGQAAGLTFESGHVEQCAAYASLLLEWNERVNLTRIVDPTEVAVKHFVDSAMVLRYGVLPHGARVVDVGTGAGFPGLVLKIVRPDLKVTLMDSLAKRLRFLEEVVHALGLKDVETVHSRAEDAGRSARWREQYDVAIARAVADLRVLSEYLLPLVRVGGKMVALKGPDIEDEMTGAERAVATLGGGKGELVTFELPASAGGRTVVWYPKVRSTPKAYPRKAGEPSKRPLG